MKKSLYIAAAFALFTGLSACDGLDQQPTIELSGDQLYTSVDNYRAVLAKCYTSYVIKGQVKGATSEVNSSIDKYDDGLWRILINLQEAPTDEMAYTWIDGDNLADITYMEWDASDKWVQAMYSRLYYTISLCNEFLRNAGSSSEAEIAEYALEARFLRALAYYYVTDLFGKGSMITENDPVGSYMPQAATRKDLFNYVESELNAIKDLLPATNDYPRVGQGAAYALLSRLYLNAEIYIGQGKYSECIAACEKVRALGYKLEDDYSKLFNADNNLRTNEIIFSFAMDATQTAGYGGTSYLVCGASQSVTESVLGCASSWNSFRPRKQLSEMLTAKTGDKRALLYTTGRDADVTSISDQSTGYLFTKFTNLTDAGVAASNSASDGVCTDIPVFRLAEIYLNEAEAILRGGTGNLISADDLINLVRDRADVAQNTGYTLNDILTERAKELYMESVRRTDLVRFNTFAGDQATYNWQWKGKIQTGTTVDKKYNHYPIPTTELSANTNLSNEDY